MQAFYLSTVDGGRIELPIPDDWREHEYVMALVHCQPRWADLSDLRAGRIGVPETWVAGRFEYAPTLLLNDAEGEFVAVPAPYDCADGVYVLGLVDGGPGWTPYDRR